MKSNGNKKVGYRQRLIKSIPGEDMAVLNKWKNSNEMIKWDKAVAILDACKGHETSEIAMRVERNPDAVGKWIRLYKRHGIAGLLRKKRKANEKQINDIEEKKKNLIKLIHEKPSIHGINRASWSIKSLAVAYSKAYGADMSRTTIGSYIKDEGYSFSESQGDADQPRSLVPRETQKNNGYSVRSQRRRKILFR